MTGQPIALVPSDSEPNVYHYVALDGRCSCKGYQCRRTCRHTAKRNPLADGGVAHLQVQRATGNWPTASIMGKATEYQSIFGRDE